MLLYITWAFALASKLSRSGNTNNLRCFIIFYVFNIYIRPPTLFSLSMFYNQFCYQRTCRHRSYFQCYLIKVRRSAVLFLSIQIHATRRWNFPPFFVDKSWDIDMGTCVNSQHYWTWLSIKIYFYTFYCIHPLLKKRERDDLEENFNITGCVLLFDPYPLTISLPCHNWMVVPGQSLSMV